MTGGWCTGKNFEGVEHGVSNYYCSIFLKEQRKARGNLNHDSVHGEIRREHPQIQAYSVTAALTRSVRSLINYLPLKYPSVCLSIWILCYTLDIFITFLILYSVGWTAWTGDQPVARHLPTHRTTQAQNKRTQTSMPLVEFEPTIPVFERAKTVYILGSVILFCPSSTWVTICSSGPSVYVPSLMWTTTRCM
jgi:hypothetical protein